MLQGERDLSTVSNLVLSELAPLINAQHAVFYVSDRDDDGQMVLNLAASYAFNNRKHLANQFKLARGPDRPVRLREVAHPADQRARRTTSRSRRASARRRRPTSSSCRPCSRAR